MIRPKVRPLILEHVVRQGVLVVCTCHAPLLIHRLGQVVGSALQNKVHGDAHIANFWHIRVALKDFLQPVRIHVLVLEDVEGALSRLLRVKCRVSLEDVCCD